MAYNDIVYLDYAATTPISPKVLRVMAPFFSDYFGNPSGSHYHARFAREAVESARTKVADALNASASEIIFTSGGTESNNLAIRGLAFQRLKQGKEIIISPMEHASVINTVTNLKKHYGFKIKVLPVNQEGEVSSKDLQNYITEETILISINYVNSETGVIQDIPNLAAVAKKNKIAFHTDASQAALCESLDVIELGITAMTLSGHKIYAPKGVGCLYLKQNTPIFSLQTGGGQEAGKRAGTENVASIVGFAEAVDILALRRIEYKQDLLHLQHFFEKKLGEHFPLMPIFSRHANRSPHIVGCSFIGMTSDSLLMHFDRENICISSTSACSVGTGQESSALQAMNIKQEIRTGQLRFSFSSLTTISELEMAIDCLLKIQQHLTL